MLLFNKILPLLVLPLGFSIICMLLGIILKKRLLLSYGVLWLWLFSMPVVGDGLMRFVEGGSFRVAVASLPKADGIVVLSGMIDQVKGAPRGEWNGAVDRFEGGIDLFRAGKAPLLVFTRGQIPWQTDAVPEGELLKPRAVALGIPASAIRLTGKAENTADEALESKKLFGLETGVPKKIILVTSAFHMQRAAMLFEHAGFEVIPFRVDYRTADRYGATVLRYLPDYESLDNSATALRELLGRLFYWTRSMLKLS